MKKLVINGKTISEHLKAFLEAFKRKLSETWEWIKEHKTGILITLGAVAGVAVGAYTLSNSSDSEDYVSVNEDDGFSFEPTDYNTYDPQGYEPEEPHQPRYLVERKAFKTGEWYNKTETDWKPAAFSVAKDGGWGRATRLIDRETGEILYETEEDPGMKELNELAHYDLLGARGYYSARDEESLDVSDASLIWAFSGMDEDYDFGYTEEELKATFDS